jgi:sugar lactone lactonase YvrE
MRRRTPIVIAASLAAGASALAIPHDHEFEPPPPFTLFGPGIGGARAAPAGPAYLTASRIAAVGDGALAIDADSGSLLRVDHAGAKTAELAIGRDAGLLAYDPVQATAYVADRGGDRVAVVRVADHGLTLARSWLTPAEPFGVALSIDGRTALVTTIADRTLVAYDAGTGREAWRVALGAEPRGVAVSTDGARAIVSYLESGIVDEVALAAPHTVTHVALDARTGVARGGFAAAYLGPSLAVAAFQVDSPSGTFGETNEGRYGGGGEAPPINYELAFLDRAGGLQQLALVSANQPRALAWDGEHDALWIAGMGNDAVVRIDRASQVDPAYGTSFSLAGSGAFPGDDRCGADGLAVSPRGELLVWCSFTREIARIDDKGLTRGPSLVASAMDDTQHTGMVVFHTADQNISAFGGTACAGCHLDGRTDGNSWAIGGRALQTPLLGGRLVGTAPYKWDGRAPDLRSSLVQTIKRLGGTGLSKRHLSALEAYLDAMPAVRTPTRDPAAVARGKSLFESSDLGCASCHEGASYTDRERHALDHAPEIDTPSLIGVAASAPYFHDGSAATLEEVLRDRGDVHGMSAAARDLGDAQLADLIAYLETR